MKILKGKDLRKGNFKAVESKITKYVKRHQPVYMGEILKDMRMSQAEGQRLIIDLLHAGRLKYKKGSSKIVK